jgi:hypothetical protein
LEKKLKKENTRIIGEEIEKGEEIAKGGEKS